MVQYVWTGFDASFAALSDATRRARIGCFWMPLGCAQFGCLAALLLVAIPLLVWRGVRYGWAAAGTLVAGIA